MFSRYKNTGKRKPYLIFSLTDETFSLVANSKDQDYFFFVSILDHLYWVMGTMLGSLISNVVSFNTEGLDFVLTALFIVIFIDQWLNSRDNFSALCGLLITGICLVIFGKDNFLIPSMMFIVSILLLRMRIKGGGNE